MLTVDAGLTPGSTLQPQYFRSKAFVDVLHSDTCTLLSTFTDRLDPNTTDSPFSVFKSIWIELGWPDVHLSMLEPALKGIWWDTLTRGFIDRLDPAEAPSVPHLGALYALYTLFYTQPDPVLHIRLAPLVIEHLFKLVEDVTRSAKDDTLYLLTRFIKDAVYIVPESLRADPVLPSNRTSGRPLARQDAQELAKLSYAIECEARSLAVCPPKAADNNNNNAAWLEAYGQAQESYVEARDDVRALGEQQPKVREVLDRAEGRLVSAYPGAFQQDQRHLGMFASQAGDLEHKLKGLPWTLL